MKVLELIGDGVMTLCGTCLIRQRETSEKICAWCLAQVAKEANGHPVKPEDTIAWILTRTDLLKATLNQDLEELAQRLDRVKLNLVRMQSSSLSPPQRAETERTLKGLDMAGLQATFQQRIAKLRATEEARFLALNEKVLHLGTQVLYQNGQSQSKIP